MKFCPAVFAHLGIAVALVAAALATSESRGATATDAKDSKEKWDTPQPLWSLQPVRVASSPQPKNAKWAWSDIDRFVLASLESRGLKPVADAKPEALLRRIFFDLIGLPPTPTEIDSFLQSSIRNPQSALQAVVDRLLASPQFGERWGRHWLDVARYAESSGKDVNVTFPHAWRYRDYVIQSFNDDLPYDRFVREQVAGDLLPVPTSVAGSVSDEKQRARQAVATGFLAVGAKSLNEINPRQFAVDLADEQIDTVTQGVLGLTVACARCHDHKFDPISQKQYTALAGIFLSTETKFGTPGGVQGRNLSSLLDLSRGKGKSDLPIVARGMPPLERQRKQSRVDDLRAQQRQALSARANGKSATDGLTNFDIVRIITQISQIQSELDGVNTDGTAKPLAMGVMDKPLTMPTGPGSGRGPGRPGGGPGMGPPGGGGQGANGGRRQASGFEIIGDSPLFGRGDIANAGSTVARGLSDLLPGVPAPTIAKGSSGRRELSEWLTDKNNPLTARVMTNRTWHWLFGRGIVASVDNFGTTGAAPSHPELLDNLAAKFAASGWSVKKLVREIVLSHTYQLSAAYDEKNFAADPEGALLWRHNPRRLEAEEIRDAMLAAAGALESKPPAGSLIGKAGDGPIGGERNMAVSEEQVAKYDSNCRSIYLPIARNVQPEVLAVFDFPDGAGVRGAREVTNVPGQSLFLLNSEFVARQSGRLAACVLKTFPGGATDTFDERYNLTCRLIFNRSPEPAERDAARKLAARHATDATAAWTGIARALLASGEFRYLE